MYELRVLSNEYRQQEHEKIINWVDLMYTPNGPSEALTMVLPTKGCKYATANHGGCSMCTLPTDNPLQPSQALIQSLPERAWEIFNNKGGSKRFRGVKFYTSGSYIDRWELPQEIQRAILAKFADHVDEIVIETRCEYVIKKNIEHLLEVIPSEKLIVAIGQETTDDEINKRSINKGHTLKQFARAVKLLQSYNIEAKGYILLKPLFISELAALEDAIRSAKEMQKLGVHHISINPSYIGKATLMDEMYKKREYRPPWLWTVYYATKFIKQMLGDDARIICDPVAAGSDRGPKNCGECDSSFKEMLKEFSASQNQKLIEKPRIQCTCESVYRSALMTENLYNGYGIFPEYPIR